MSLELGAFPEKWKDANLVLFRKVILILSCLTIGAFHFLMCFLNYWKGKFILRSLLLYPLNYIAQWLHGFLPGRSTVSQLTQVIRQFARALEIR